MWKCLPIPNGTILFVNNDRLARILRDKEGLLIKQYQYPPMDKGRVLRVFLGSLLNNLEIRYGFSADFIKNIYGRWSLISENHKRPEFNYKIGINKVSLRIAAGINMADVCRKRRENYNFWLQELSEKNGMDIVFRNLADGVSPLLFPIITEETDILIQEMSDKGIFAHRWPTLPKEIVNNPEYPTANFLAQHLITLPMHQGIDRNNLERILRI